jgi:hypothetical protein
MGQQQLLLILLGTILAGMAAYAGVQYFNTQNSDAFRDRCRLEALQMCNDADQYKLKPKALGGGGGSYTGFTLTKFYVDEPDVGYWVTGSGQSLQIYACAWGQNAALGDDGKTAVAVLLTKNGSAMTISKLN